MFRVTGRAGSVVRPLEALPFGARLLVALYRIGGGAPARPFFERLLFGLFVCIFFFLLSCSCVCVCVQCDICDSGRCSSSDRAKEHPHASALLSFLVAARNFAFFWQREKQREREREGERGRERKLVSVRCGGKGKEEEINLKIYKDITSHRKGVRGGVVMRGEAMDCKKR